MSETPKQHPFHQWVEAARPRNQAWRTVAGALIAVAVWFAWTMVLMLGAVASGMVTPDAFRSMFGISDAPLTYEQTLIALLMALVTIWGFTLGVWAAAWLVHKRSLTSIIAWDRRFSLRQFGIGCAVAAGYLAVSLTVSVLSGHVPRRSGLEVGTWLVALVPVAIVVFLQAASEELMFRGYLPQQLAARFQHPVLWGLIPSVLFGFMHAANAPGNQVYTIYYVLIATVMGLVMTAMVWRTGSIAAAIGFHFINNIGALTVAGSDGGSSSLALFVFTPDQLMASASVELLIIGALLAFVLSPLLPLPKGQPLVRRNETRAAP